MIKKKGLALRKSKGFTLVELVVVMAIIAILVALALFAINAARLGSRNTTRRSDIQSLKVALESYFTAQSPKTYPVCGAATPVYESTSTCSDLDDAIGGYLPNWPANDVGGTNDDFRVCYVTDDPGPVSKYALGFQAETFATGGGPTNCANVTMSAGDPVVAAGEDFSQR